MDLPPPVLDLHDRLQLALARGADLLHRHEHAVVDRVLALRGPPALLLARLTARQTTAWRLPELRAAGVDDPLAAAEALGDLLDPDVPWEDRLALAPVDLLSAGCRRLGLPHRGRREQLVDRLTGQEGWDEARWVRLRHAGLLLRLDRWATLERTPDLSRPVLQRLGVMRWASYPPSGGALLTDRAAWDRWEELVDGWEALSDEDCAAALDLPCWPPGGLDLRPALAARLLESATLHQRAGAPAAAEAALRAVAHRPLVERGEATVRLVRLLAADRPAEARELASGARAGLSPADALALSRTARRLGGWPPDPPLQPPVQRDLRLPAEPTRLGPRFDGATVEVATSRLLAAHGRQAVWSEGQGWRTLLALLFAEVMFAPVDGQLPVPCLAGPLDWGTPAFAERRAEAVQQVWDDLERADERVLAAWERWQGVRLRGARWEFDPQHLATLARAAGPTALRAILEPLLHGGSRAARGLPDLIVLPGPSVRLPGAFPSTLGEGLALVELKTENDQVRDEQAVWFDRLVRAGVRVELWRVGSG